uniref:HNH endonuclease n=1 Tax=Marseillevirus LCMAC103 TaxID=2506604 RepID=A0A481YTN7_9VIRU|nr:MAG: HNH endonuclease [Marseillevirus LCMAC103]
MADSPTGLERYTVPQLRSQCKKHGIPSCSRAKKAEIIAKIAAHPGHREWTPPRKLTPRKRKRPRTEPAKPRKPRKPAQAQARLPGFLDFGPDPDFGAPAEEQKTPPAAFRPAPQTALRPAVAQIIRAHREDISALSRRMIKEILKGPRYRFDLSTVSKPALKAAIAAGLAAMRTPSPKRGKTPSPRRGKTPSPKRGKTPSPRRGKTPSPKRRKTPSPKRAALSPKRRPKPPSPAHHKCSREAREKCDAAGQYCDTHTGLCRDVAPVGFFGPGYVYDPRHKIVGKREEVLAHLEHWGIRAPSVRAARQKPRSPLLSPMAAAEREAKGAWLRKEAQEKDRRAAVRLQTAWREKLARRAAAARAKATAAARAKATAAARAKAPTARRVVTPPGEHKAAGDWPSPRKPVAYCYSADGWTPCGASEYCSHTAKKCVPKATSKARAVLVTADRREIIGSDAALQQLKARLGGAIRGVSPRKKTPSPRKKTPSPRKKTPPPRKPVFPAAVRKTQSADLEKTRQDITALFNECLDTLAPRQS